MGWVIVDGADPVDRLFGFVGLGPADRRFISRMHFRDLHYLLGTLIGLTSYINRMFPRGESLGYLAFAPFLAIPVSLRDTSSLALLLTRNRKHIVNLSSTEHWVCERVKDFRGPDHLLFVKSRTCL